MKKDALIMKELYDYADQIAGDDAILSGAYQELYRIQTERLHGQFVGHKTAKKSGYGWIAGVFASAAAVLVLCIVVFQGVLFGGKKNETYALEELNSRMITAQQAKAYYPDLLILDMPGANMHSQFKVHTGADENAYVISARYRVMTASGMDELRVYADLKNGLRDFEKLQTQTEIRKNFFGILDVYQDGEYYSSVYFREKNKAYYAVIMSPVAGSADAYLDVLE